MAIDVTLRAVPAPCVLKIAQFAAIAALACALSRVAPAAPAPPESGDAASELKLADAYLLGVEGATKDIARGMAYLRKSVDQGFAPAELQLAAQYRLGEGVPKDAALALYWEGKAADGGNVAAQMVMGERYAAGVGVAKDLGRAIAWYRKAAAPWSFYRYRAETRLAALEKIQAGR